MRQESLHMNTWYGNCLWRWQHHHVFPLAVSEGDHIPINQLHVPTRSDQLAIEFCAVGALQVNQVRLDFVRFVSVLICRSLVAELYDSMLLRDARVFECEVCNILIATREPATTLI